jgi:prepilin-type N-terminal cleavage/methylation domain-containing protein
MERQNQERGFTLVELMIVVAIIAFLSMIAVPNFKRYIAKAKRAEAFMNLGSLYTAQKIYWAEHGCYTADLAGLGGAGWKPEGYIGNPAKERFYYTYGFGQGKEGQHYFTGKGGGTVVHLQQAKVDRHAFLAIAAADIDGDGKFDIIGINENHELVIFQDDLAE